MIMPLFLSSRQWLPLLLVSAWRYRGVRMPRRPDAVVAHDKADVDKPIFTAGKGQDQRKLSRGQPAEIRLLRIRHILNLHMGTL